MAISCRCDRCGRTYKMGDQWAGKSVKCKDCGGSMTVPSASDDDPAPDFDVYGLNEPESADPVGLAPGSQPVANGQSGQARAPSITSTKTRSARSGSQSSGAKIVIRSAIGTMVVIAIVGVGVSYRYLASPARQENHPAKAAEGGALASLPHAAPL